MGRRLLAVSLAWMLPGCVDRSMWVRGADDGESTGAGETAAGSTSANVPTTTEPPETGTTTDGGRPDCQALDEATCTVQSHCDWSYGRPIDVTAQCLGESTFVACLRDGLSCSGTPVVACADGLAVLFGGGCVPPGFVACDQPVPADACP